MQIPQSLFIIVLSFTIIFAQQISITCTVDSSSSRINLKYVQVKSSGSTRQLFTGNDQYSQCDFEQIKVNAFYCQNDYENKLCSSKSCILPVTTNFCNNLTSNCPYKQTTSIECKSCQDEKNGCTGKCIYSGEQISCYGSETCAFTVIEGSFSECSDGKDIFGKSCSCCAMLSVKQQVGICTAGYSFENSDFNKFVRNYTNNYSSFSSTHTLKLIFLLSIAMLLIN